MNQSVRKSGGSRARRIGRRTLAVGLLVGLAGCQRPDWTRYRLDRVQHLEQEFIADRAVGTQTDRGTLALGDAYLRFCPEGDRPCLLVYGQFPSRNRFVGAWGAALAQGPDRSRFDCRVGGREIRCTETLREESGRPARIEHRFTRIDG